MELGVFVSLEPEPLEKKTGAVAAKKLAGSSDHYFKPLGKKIRSRSRLKKKSGAGAAQKLACSPALSMDTENDSPK